ncbi:MAG: HlyD family efflux transporter periplasmic adaptor subunit, partial [Myxococcales bacterium]|nr:HlyD family efflux transporter periplasmic adaptor subunit [Myxococcales bacterium]
MSTGKTLARAALAIGVLAVGGGVMGGLIAMKKGPEKVERPEHATLVETRPIDRGDHRLSVTAFGAVIPAKEVVVMPEVAGRVRWQNEDLVPGGRIKAGETLLRIDPTSYALQVQAQSASVEQAEQQLALEQSRKRIAESEWQAIGEDANATPEGRAVALREPQLKVAKASVRAAKSAQNLARVNLGRTTLKVPFNAFVRQESVDVGQLVGPQSVLATLVGTDHFWVQVSVPLDKLSRIRIPGVNAEAGEGSRATVIQRMGEQRVEREGEVVRLMGDLDPAGRMARVLVQIPDPMALAAREAEVAPGRSVPEGKQT